MVQQTGLDKSDGFVQVETVVRAHAVEKPRCDFFLSDKTNVKLELRDDVE